MASLYVGPWSDAQDVCSAFNEPKGTLKGCRVFVACYDQQDYSGSAFVLYAKGKTLYEVHGSHCSCYGLEEQWSPEDTTIDSLRHRLKHGNLDALTGGNGTRVLQAVKRYLKKFD
jgi:hypothetical protein